MRPSGTRRNATRAVTYGVIAAAALVAVRNATVYPAIAGYDALEAIEYAQGIVPDGRFPDANTSSARWRWSDFCSRL